FSRQSAQEGAETAGGRNGQDGSARSKITMELKGKEQRPIIKTGQSRIKTALQTQLIREMRILVRFTGIPRLSASAAWYSP
ncbi:hypothetical protein DBR11_29205, partial [Pedobacter sp. HMWF019]|uniref:hypothetical protein n=1 Tax=Pedobacter sp. HMWF019 TaxID=2056856 RepID=UPI000D481446